jgi:hypothetical protein
MRFLAFVTISSFLNLLIGCNPCSSEILEQTSSPNKQWTAETIMRDCGATTAETITVSIRSLNDKADSRKDIFTVKHGYAISTVWQDSEHLKISCRECIAKDVLYRDSAAGPILVSYELP